MRWEVWTHEIGEATAKRRFPRVFVENRFGSSVPYRPHKTSRVLSATFGYGEDRLDSFARGYYSAGQVQRASKAGPFQNRFQFIFRFGTGKQSETWHCQL